MNTETGAPLCQCPESGHEPGCMYWQAQQAMKEQDPATCPVELIQDSPDRKVAQIGTDCLGPFGPDIKEDDLEMMYRGEGVYMHGMDCALYWLAGDCSPEALRDYGYSSRFAAVCEHFRSQGYDYLWLDADRQTQIGEAPTAITLDASKLDLAAIKNHPGKVRMVQPEPVNARLLEALKYARKCAAYCRQAHDDPQKGSGIPVEFLWDEIIAEAEAQGK